MSRNLIESKGAEFGDFIPISFIYSRIFKDGAHGFKNGVIEPFRQTILLRGVSVGRTLFD